MWKNLVRVLELLLARVGTPHFAELVQSSVVNGGCTPLVDLSLLLQLRSVLPAAASTPYQTGTVLALAQKAGTAPAELSG